MRQSYYDILQVSSRAQYEVISVAYQRLKEDLKFKVQDGSDEARNQLLFVEEAYAVLSNPERRAAYDRSVSIVANQKVGGGAHFEPTYQVAHSGGGYGKYFLVIALFSVAFGIYKFTGQSRTLQITEQRELGVVRNDSYRAESERMQGQGSLEVQHSVVDKSYDIASREAERRRAETEARKNAADQLLEMQRRQQEARMQDQQWRQAQYERERELREKTKAVDEPKRQLCTMYNLNGKYAEARAAGCDRM